MGSAWVPCGIDGIYVGRIFPCGIRMEICHLKPMWVIPHGLHVGTIWYLHTWEIPRGFPVGFAWELI